MSDAAWSSITVFVTDPRETGRLHRALGVPVRIIDAALVEVGAPAGPLIRLVAAEVPSRTHTAFRIRNPELTVIGLDALGVRWRTHAEGVMAMRDPDGNHCYGVPARDGHPRHDLLSMWSLFVTDADVTARWLRDLLGPAVSTRQIRLGTAGGGEGEVLREDVTFAGSDRTLALLPAAGGRTTEASLSFEVPDLEPVADRLAAAGRAAQRRGSRTLVTWTPDGCPVYLTPAPKLAEAIGR